MMNTTETLRSRQDRMNIIHNTQDIKLLNFEIADALRIIGTYITRFNSNPEAFALNIALIQLADNLIFPYLNEHGEKQ